MDTLIVSLNDGWFGSTKEKQGWSEGCEVVWDGQMEVDGEGEVRPCKRWAYNRRIVIDCRWDKRKSGENTSIDEVYEAAQVEVEEGKEGGLALSQMLDSLSPIEFLNSD